MENYVSFCITFSNNNYFLYTYKAKEKKNHK